ncbi:MAG: hypothetical protein QM640_01735 [Niabella sp.]
MESQTGYPYINWTDGMKLSKDIFIGQDHASVYAMQNLIASTLSPICYGLLPVENNFNVQISVDNQYTVRVTVLSCKAIAAGGAHINISAAEQHNTTDGNPSVSVTIPAAVNEVYWIVLTVQPFERHPFGNVDPNENPPRFPYVKPGHIIEVVPQHDFNQYALNPFALVIGKLLPVGGTVKVDTEYLPPCIAVSASQDLLGLHAELDSFLAKLESACSQIVQKIYKKSQQNELAELAQFCCDRIMLYLSKAITDFRWLYIYESPAKMISAIAGLARVLKNTLDLRTGSGKDELMNYLSEWCELNQGELESLLNNMAALRYNHNDVNQNIADIIEFAKVIGKLFNTLSNLEFIGKKKEAGIFVKEGYINDNNDNAAQKPKRRFFG